MGGELPEQPPPHCSSGRQAASGLDAVILAGRGVSDAAWRPLLQEISVWLGL